MKNTKTKPKTTVSIKKTKWFWVFFVVAAVGLALGIFLLPVWKNANVFWRDWSTDALDLILFVVILLYVCWLIKSVKEEASPVVKKLKIVEIVVLCLLAVCCLLQYFDILSFIGPCFVFGAIFWCRGCLYIVKAYLFTHKKKENYPLFLLIVSILLVTVGAMLMVRPVQNAGFIWIVAIAVLVVSLASLVYGFLSIPSKTPAPTEN